LLLQYKDGQPLDDTTLSMLQAMQQNVEESHAFIQRILSRKSNIGAFRLLFKYMLGVLKAMSTLNSIGRFEARKSLLHSIDTLLEQSIAYQRKSSLVMDLVKLAKEYQDDLNAMDVNDTPSPTIRCLARILRKHAHVCTIFAFP
jgi:hypothetical protein